MPSTVKNINGTIETIFTTELNSMANNALVLSSALSPLSGEDGYLSVVGELLISFGSSPTANTAFILWFLPQIDGTNYEDGGTGVTPARTPDMIFTVRATTGAQRLMALGSPPVGNYKILIKNNGTGQSIASSGNTLKMIRRTEQF